MMLSRLQLPPLPRGASHTTIGGPPEIWTVFSLPSAKNPMDRLSGDQNGKASVFGAAIGVAVRLPIGRSQSRYVGRIPATKTMCWPSGETASCVALPVPPAAGPPNDVVLRRRDGEPRRTRGGRVPAGGPHVDDRGGRTVRGPTPRRPATGRDSIAAAMNPWRPWPRIRRSIRMLRELAAHHQDQSTTRRHRRTHSRSGVQCARIWAHGPGHRAPREFRPRGSRGWPRRRRCQARDVPAGPLSTAPSAARARAPTAARTPSARDESPGRRESAACSRDQA